MDEDFCTEDLEEEMEQLTRAIIMAAEAHDGQVDKAGEPYIFHPLRVMRAGKTEEERIVGVLHDVMEDSCIDHESIQYDFGVEIADAVLALTYEKNTPHIEYIRSLRQIKLARDVKLNDLLDNLDGKRMEKLPRETRKRLIRKYVSALFELCNRDYAFSNIVHARGRISDAECYEDFGEVLVEMGYYKQNPEDM